MRSQIDDDLRDGRKSDRQLARDYGALSHHNVGRHRRMGHVLPDPSGNGQSRVSVGVRPDPNDRSPIGMLRSTLHRLERMDTRKLSPQMLMQHADGVRRTVEAIHKMDAPEKRVASLREVKGLSELIHILAEEMEAYPDVRERISARLRDEVDFGEGLPNATPGGRSAAR